MRRQARRPRWGRTQGKEEVMQLPLTEHISEKRVAMMNNNPGEKKGEAR